MRDSTSASSKKSSRHFNCHSSTVTMCMNYINFLSSNHSDQRFKICCGICSSVWEINDLTSKSSNLLRNFRMYFYRSSQINFKIIPSRFAKITLVIPSYFKPTVLIINTFFFFVFIVALHPIEIDYLQFFQIPG